MFSFRSLRRSAERVNRGNPPDLRVLERQLTENSSYFNTGVLLVNAKKWQDEKISQSSIELANRVAGRTKLRDQTIMNVTCHQKVKKLDPRFNRVVLPKKEATLAANGDSLLHFIGSPKPWEYLAERLHPSAGSWRQIAQRVGYHFNPPAWPRTYADVETLLRLLKRKFR